MIQRAEMLDFLAVWSGMIHGEEGECSASTVLGVEVLPPSSCHTPLIGGGQWRYSSVKSPRQRL